MIKKIEPYRLAHSDECCLDKCKCGGQGRTIQMSELMTVCQDCKIIISGKNYVDNMIKWNKLQRGIKSKV